MNMYVVYQQRPKT